MLGELSKDKRRLAIKSSGEAVFVWTISGIVLAACGGGGGGGGGLSFGSRGPTVALPSRVNVSDGPASGARVYFDTDGDGEVSAAEIAAQGNGYGTGADGRTGVLPSAYRGAAFVAIVDGAIDTDTGKTLSGSYLSIASPDGQHRIATPITDLIARAQREDETTEDVVARILTAAQMNPATANQQLEHILDPDYYDTGTNKHGDDLFIISLTNEVVKDKASGRPETDPIRLVTDAVNDGYLTPATISYANTGGIFAENFDTSNHLATLTHPIAITTAVIVGVVYTDKTTGREVTLTGASDRAAIDRLFSIDLNGGSPQISFVGTGGLDFESVDEYTLTVDLGDASAETVPALVKIIVIDVNALTMTTSGTATLTEEVAGVAGGTETGFSITLADDDTTNNHAITIDDITLASRFDFVKDSTTANQWNLVLLENQKVDREDDGATLTLAYTITDDTNTPINDTIAVSIIDTNDNAPTMTLRGDAVIKERLASDTGPIVAGITITIADADATDAHDSSVSGGPRLTFTVYDEDGTTVNNDYAVVRKAGGAVNAYQLQHTGDVLDASATSSVSLNIGVTDGVNPSPELLPVTLSVNNIDNADLSITTGNTVISVEDAGGSAIPETTEFYALNLNENVDGAVLEITAIDPEIEASSTHSVLGVSLDQAAIDLGFALAHSGNSDNIYILSGSSHGLNYEARAANAILSTAEMPMPFTITASFEDPTDNSVRRINIRINPQDVDEYEIEFTDDATKAELDYAPSITIDHTGMVTKVEAIDDDATAVLSYSITGNSFVIDATSGVITVAAGVTLTASTYELTVTATDATSGDTKTQSVEVTVTGEPDTVPPDDDDNNNDDAPSDDLADAEIYENHPLSKVIGSIAVPDGANFMLSDGFDNALFHLDTEGKLWWRATPDFESPTDSDGDNMYQINVTFTYTDGTPTSSQRYDLEVQNIGPGRYDYGSSNRDGGARTYLHHRPDIPLPEEPGGLSNYILHGHAFVTPEMGPLILTWAHDPDSDYTAAQARPITERAFALYEAVANIKFIEVDWSASKDIEIFFNQGANTGSAATRHRNNVQVDEIRISAPTIEDSETDYFSTVIHEIGHILGLKHPFDERDEGGWSWDAAHRNNPNTIMSYYDFDRDPNRGDELLPADIAALRFLYGPPEGTAGAEDWEPPHWLVRSNNFRYPPSPSSEPIFISETAAAGTELYTITVENNFFPRFPNPPTLARSEYELRNGQGDNEFFQIDSVTGVLSLKQKLDYGNPLDQGSAYLYTGNNVYEVVINGRYFFDDAATQARLGNKIFAQYVPIVVLESIDLAQEGLTDINLVTRGAAKTPTDYGGKEVIGTDGVNRISDGHGYDIIRGNGNDDIITLTTTPKDENEVIYRIGNQVAIDGGDQVMGFERGKDKLILALPENMTTSAITNFAGFVSHINGGTSTDLTDDWFGVKLVTDAGKTMLQGLSFHFEKIVVGAGSSSVMHITFSTSLPLSDALGSATLASITNSDGFLTDFGLLDDLLGGEQSFKFITEEFTIPTNTTYAPTLSVAYTAGTAGTIDESVDAGTAVTGITFTAGDVDGGSLTYHIIGGDGMHIFEILETNRTTGKITLKANATLDDETKPNYTLNVVVRDSDGATSIPVEVNINVTEEPRSHSLKVRATNDAPNHITDFDRGKDKLTFMFEATDIGETGSSLKNGDSISEFIKYVTNDSIDWKDDPLSIVLDYRFPHGQTQVELHGLSFYSRVGVSDDDDSVLVGKLTFSEAVSNHQEIINFHGGRQKILDTTNGNAILVDLDYLDDLLGGVDSLGFEIV